MSFAADLVLINGSIWTGSPTRSGALGCRTGEPSRAAGASARVAQAAAIANGRFLGVGSNEEAKAAIGPNTTLIDLGGAMAMPAFIDSHVHFLAGSLRLSEVKLKDAGGPEEFVRRVSERASALAPGSWMLGGSWDETAWPQPVMPTRWMIDADTVANPVCLSRSDGHAVLVNSPVLRMAGIDRQTPDPPGGLIVRDERGEPTGVLKDAAAALVQKLIPPPTWEEFEATLQTGLAEARRLGVASVHDMYLTDWSPSQDPMDMVRLLRKAEQAGLLTCRFYQTAPIERWRDLERVGIGRAFGGAWLRTGVVKAFTDGSLGSRTAWFFDEYCDAPGDCGVSRWEMAELIPLVKQATEAGLQTVVHAIGDRAVAETLAIMEQAGGADSALRRFRIEHAQHLRPQDFAVFGRLGVVASMQPYHAVDDGRWLETRLGPARAQASFAWRSMLDAGAVLAFGSDWPIAPLNPLLGIHAAVTRQTLDGRHPEGWIPEQRVTLEEALRAYTYGGAYAEFQENEKGTIARGKLADLVVLSEDLFRIPPDRIKDVQVTMTVVDGKVVYRA